MTQFPAWFAYKGGLGSGVEAVTDDEQLILSESTVLPASWKLFPWTKGNSASWTAAYKNACAWAGVKASATPPGNDDGGNAGNNPPEQTSTNNSANIGDVLGLPELHNLRNLVIGIVKVVAGMLLIAIGTVKLLHIDQAVEKVAPVVAKPQSTGVNSGAGFWSGGRR
jgi:hypothetical protein